MTETHREYPGHTGSPQGYAKALARGARGVPGTPLELSTVGPVPPLRSPVPLEPPPLPEVLLYSGPPCHDHIPHRLGSGIRPLRRSRLEDEGPCPGRSRFEKRGRRSRHKALGSQLTQALRDRTCKRREETQHRAPTPATEEPPASPREPAAATAVQAASTMNLEKAGGRLCGGKRASLPTARPFPMIQEVMASMAHLQKEKLRLQEELLELQEKLTAQENNELSLSLQLQGQVETLKEKLLEQAQEISRLRSELGGTDAEKHRDLLAAENERLRQEMKASGGCGTARRPSPASSPSLSR
ncbi:PREDICTED: uncharacterized protein LOC108448313 [Corvus brachyrhynchos]|uniref:uncharacterized protein LOC108448313 n=1 Tax=Corvus brachyrhynchos TaxID=85066 RepID=UPI0008164858|nr:PREDICTED: uncharacterized protein LOC108448313 [Corvus brachyrhynchos]